MIIIKNITPSERAGCLSGNPNNNSSAKLIEQLFSFFGLITNSKMLYHLHAISNVLFKLCQFIRTLRFCWLLAVSLKKHRKHKLTTVVLIEIVSIMNNYLPYFFSLLKAGIKYIIFENIKYLKVVLH